jgi:hypothetical protein
VKLLINDSDDKESDDEDILVQTQTFASTHFAAVNSFRFLFREPKYHPDVRMKGMGQAIPQWKQMVIFIMMRSSSRLFVYLKNPSSL